MQIIGAPLSAGIFFMEGIGGLRGWQWIFIIEGGVTAIYGIILNVCTLLCFVNALHHSLITLEPG
jgi:hypothetical protein